MNKKKTVTILSILAAIITIFVFLTGRTSLGGFLEVLGISNPPKTKTSLGGGTETEKKEPKTVSHREPQSGG